MVFFSPLQAFGVISEKELKSFGSDTDDKNLIYVVVTPPKNGRLQNNDKPESFVSSFTQGLSLSLSLSHIVQVFIL